MSTLQHHAENFESHLPLTLLSDDENVMKQTGKNEIKKYTTCLHFCYLCAARSCLLSPIYYLFHNLVARLAREQISPYVRDMEKEGKFKQAVIDALFSNGVNKIFCLKTGLF